MTRYQPDPELVSVGGVRAARTEGARAVLAALEQLDGSLADLVTEQGLALSALELARVEALRQSIARDRNASADGA